MIGKVITGKSFSGCVRYVVQKEGARVLDAEGIRTDTVSAMVADFNLQRSLNPELGKAVGHIALSWSTQDRDKLTPQIMAERAREYLEKMQIRDTQYLIVEHRDREHPHLHIVYNRVDFQGRTITDKLERRRNAKLCREMTIRYGYYLAPGKEQVNRQLLTGADKLKYELHDTIKEAVGKAKNWQEMERLLQAKGVTLHYKYRRGTDQVQGVSFCEGNLSFRGSRIDRSLSYGAISKQLERNRQQEQQFTTALRPQTSYNQSPTPSLISQQSSSLYTIFIPTRDLLAPSIGEAEQTAHMVEYELRKKKRKKKRRRHL
ncbi:relaxase/mobilization nuclease domain-containing protein [Pontibacter pamirensis]|uniref:relaxase/mobilization nuclease domain-containing protein n=1 Tax=Pontibacter pamirensis TaxID=2562824 RepID=UPI0013895A77|nr:relaxase/mobilization nuclease domain-containing protein [Pontibacter pamirensis]